MSTIPSQQQDGLPCKAFNGEKELWRRNATDKRGGRSLTNITKSPSPFPARSFQEIAWPDLSLELLRNEALNKEAKSELKEEGVGIKVSLVSHHHRAAVKWDQLQCH